MKVFGSGKGKRNNGSRSTHRVQHDNREPIKAHAVASSADASAVGVSQGTRGHAESKAEEPARSKPEKAEKVGKNGKPVSKAKKRVKIVAIILLILVICAAGFAVWLGVYVSGVDTIFPNVWAEGFNLSELTPGEAAQRLIAGGFEDNADAIAASIVFPDGTGFTVNGPEVGLSLDAREVAEAAFNFGRDGSMLENTITYVRTFLNPTELYNLSTAALDDTIIRERAAEYTRAFNYTLLDDYLEVDENRITFLKGTGIEPVDESSVFDLALFTLMHAIEENTHLTANYIPQPKVGDDLDLRSLFDSIHVEPISSVFDPELLGGTESTIGRTFDLPEAEEMIRNAAPRATVVIPIVDVYPEFTQEQIDDMIFRDVLAERSTHIGGIPNRVHNVVVASEFINGTVLLPGEVFSFNGIVGRRTRDRGFRDANALEGGRLVLQPGGGICQVSSTIYAALLKTAIFGEGIDILERRPHGLTVSYLPFGQDATVAWGSIDFRFRNSLNFPIKIETIVEGRNMNVRIIGSKFDDNFIEVEMVHISTTPPYVLDRDDPERPYGERYLWTPGQPGQVVETFQRLYDADGELISRTLVSRDVYNRQDRITLVGTYVPDEPEQPPDLPHDPPPQDPPPGGTDLDPDYNPYD